MQQLLSLLLPLVESFARARPPNVLILLADDLGVGDLEAYSASALVPTPAISALSAAGVRFTDAHAHPICSPSRYSLLSGNYVFRGRRPSSSWDLSGGSQLLPGQRTIAESFRAAGYATLLLGKAGIGGEVAALPDELRRSTEDGRVDWLLRRGRRLADGPAQWGFDESLSMVSGIQSPPYAWFNGSVASLPRGSRCWGTATHATRTGDWVSGKFAGTGLRHRRYTPCSAGDGHDGAADWEGHMADAQVAQAALGFFDRRRRARGPQPPFFALVATAAVHAPFTPPDRFRDADIRTWVATSEVAAPRRLHVPHSSMVAELDAVVGALMAALRSAGELNETIVVFASDNGGLSCATKQHGSWRPSPETPAPPFEDVSPERSGLQSPLCGANSSAHLRGHKGDLYEGGHRVPLLVAWPAGGVPAGGECGDLVGLTDLYATLLDLAGLAPPAPGQAADSVSFKRRLLRPRDGHPARSDLLVPSPPSWALRWSRWKLISLAHGSQRATELFDLEADPGETTNLLPPHNVSGAGGQPPRASGEAASRHEATAARMAQRADQILTSGELGGRKRMQALRTM